MNKKKYSYLLIIALLLLVSCGTAPPKNRNNVCAIFFQYPHWYWAAKRSAERWGVPVSVQMAIIHQESRFDGEAKPPRGKLLWVIPWFRPTSAYGYAQALNQSWKIYRRDVGRHGASRNNFYDATDFIGWYGARARKRARIPRWNAYRLYLAYHEGIGGYMRGTFRKKPWLVTVARKVNTNSLRYHRQLLGCAAHIPKRRWWQFWK